MPVSYPKKSAAPAPMAREERAESKMGKAAYARAEAAESPAKKAAEAAKGYACGGKVKGHADGGTVGDWLHRKLFPKAAAEAEELRKVTPSRPLDPPAAKGTPPKSSPAETAPAAPSEPTATNPGFGMVGQAATALRKRNKDNEDALKEAK